MKKIGILTINDNNNYGNRLQNYALQESIKRYGFDVVTLKNVPTLNTRDKFILRTLKFAKEYIFSKFETKSERRKMFDKFNKNIKFSNFIVTPYSKLIRKRYSNFVVGSDQVWNMKFSRMRDVDFLTFADDNQKISYAASFGFTKLPKEKEKYLDDRLKNFKMISVREDAGKEIIKKSVKRDDVEVLVDPSMLLTDKEWNEVTNKPEQLKTDRYILNYFLGELSEKRKNEIDRIAKENDCEVINILDKNSPFYQTGPSEFLYLEKNAFLICTDSFHSSVFAILYNRPFIVFDREENIISMNSRIETLINKFKLKNRKFEGKITKENLEHDYTEAYKILDEEREKSKRFLEKVLDIK